MHGGVAKKELGVENIEALRAGFANLQKHVDSIKEFGLPFVVAINKFVTDTELEISVLKELCEQAQIPVALTEVWEKGGNGGIELAQKVLAILEKKEQSFQHLYSLNTTIEEKVHAIATKIYGANRVEYSSKAKKQIADFEKYGWGHLPICMAKTQYSLSDDPSLIGRPEGFSITIREFKPSIGAGFLVALTGEVMTMPGLPKTPAALNMDVDEDGKAVGLF